MAQNDLDKPFSGGLGSFKLYVLVASHIEKHVKLGGSDRPGEILLSFFFRYGSVPGYSNINSRARTTLSQFEVISTADGSADMSPVFQVQNCITVFAACWHRLQSKVKRNMNPNHSLLRFMVDPEELRSRRRKCQQKASLIKRFCLNPPVAARRPNPSNNVDHAHLDTEEEAEQLIASYCQSSSTTKTKDSSPTKSSKKRKRLSRSERRLAKEAEEKGHV